MVDSICTRNGSFATATEVSNHDQYADGKAAKLWEVYIGDKSSRTEHYKTFLLDLLRGKNCQNILDVACGTGIDSVMLVEEKFDVTSVDASDKMLKYALKIRWTRRKDPHFDNWVIEEANWLTLLEDLEMSTKEIERSKSEPEGKKNSIKLRSHDYDSVICLGNSFPQLPDFIGDSGAHKKALSNFAKCVRPGGILIIDHRNYDYYLDNGKPPPSKNIYYNCPYVSDFKMSVLPDNGGFLTFDYIIDVSCLGKAYESLATNHLNQIRMESYPHRLASFTSLLLEAFDSKCKHTVYGDFKPLGEVRDPGFYVHVVEKLE